MHDENGHDEVTDGSSSPWLDRVNDAYYDRLGEGMGRSTRDRINWMCARCDGRTVLDVGCSQGITSILLGREGFEALGIDITAEAIAFAEGELSKESEEVRARVEFHRMDLLSMPCGEGYDNVVLGEVVEHQTSAPRFLRAAAAHVAPGGRLIVTVPFGLHPFPDHKCTVFPRDVVDALGDAFDYDCIEVSEGYVRIVATRAADVDRVPVDRDALLDATEKGTRESQARYFELLQRSRALQTTKKEQAERLRLLHEKYRVLSLQTERDLSKSREEMAQLRSQVLALRNESLRTETLVAASNQQLNQMAKENAALREQAGRVAGLEKRVVHLADYRSRLEHQHETVKRRLSEANAELAIIRNSESLRLGMVLMSALRSPRDFIALPVRLGRMFVGGLRRRSNRRASPRTAADSTEDDPATESWRHRNAAEPLSTPRSVVQQLVLKEPACVLPPVVAVNGDRARAPMLAPVAPAAVPDLSFPARMEELRVAAIMDDFTRESFRHCCQLLQLTPENWQKELQRFQPHVVLVESAWRGEADRWVRKIYPLSTQLAELVKWSRGQNIPTAFWNKEDPIHFSVFLATARLFDHVFTTDIDCVKSYRFELGHGRVHLLPFACEPQTHNPLELYERKDSFCFAGSYYAKYPERQRDFASLVDALLTLRPVDIFDRNHGKGEPSLTFPETYGPLIRGSLPYDQIDRAYKGYRYGININSVKQSQSMFARRAFELLASNTVTVSNYSRGLRLMFGDLIVSTDHGVEAARRLRPLVQDEVAFRKYRLLGLRKVLSEHTYEDRLGFIVEKITGNAPAKRFPEIVVVARVTSAATSNRVISAFDRQDYPSKRLLLVQDEAVATATGLDRKHINVIGPAEASRMVPASQFPGAFIARFVGDDYYGRHYLFDLALATRYSDADVIGKRSHYAFTSDGGLELMEGGLQYASVDALPSRASMIRSERISATLLALVDGSGDETWDVPSTLAIDEFNYARYWPAESCAIVDDPELHQGIAMARLQSMAEIEHEARDVSAAAATLSECGASELCRLFPPGEYANGRLRLDVSPDGVEIVSNLAHDKHAYLYAESPIALDTLFVDEIGRFNLLVSSDMLLSITLIFLDADQKRIGHVIRACNSNQSVMPLEGTRSVLLGVRVQGPGLATVRTLVLQHIPLAIDALAGTAKNLIISRSYPGYGNIYDYTFVHRRAFGYRRYGLNVDVFRFSDAPLAYEEFEGLDIVSGNMGDLTLMLRSNSYETLLIHSFDDQVWSSIQPYLQQSRVIVWVHGAEIQPWYRRDFNFANEADRRRGIQRSDMRMSLWRQVLEDMHPNLHLVFVSEFLARQAMQDLGVVIPLDRYSVIHNAVNVELFDYVEKPVDQGNRILSVRPYTKATYANDLAVKAILDLAMEPWFNELRFRIVGDGPLFDSTVAPLREGFPNVVIDKGFLTQQQLRTLHKDYGVFLVPSRVDSQGVSRDEAMASGLVPITNAVAAIPEFVDDQVAFLAPAEDWRALADAIRVLHSDSARFQRMSCAAAAHVRKRSGPQQTLMREIALIRHGIVSPSAIVQAASSGPRRIAVYGDLNLNLIDGATVWAASLVQVLAGLENVEIDLFLRTRLFRTEVVAPLLNLPNARLIEPGHGGDVAALTPDEALAKIIWADTRSRYDAIVLRGYKLAVAGAQDPTLAGRIWVYLTDIPQEAALLDAAWLSSLGQIARASKYVLCQTAALEDLLQQVVPAMRGKTRRLPPMIPCPIPSPESDRVTPIAESTLRIVYAGTFAPLWGSREMLEVAENLGRRGVPFELHVYGSKFHNPPTDPGFSDDIADRLQRTPGVIWHRCVSRAVLLAALPTMDIGWAWRHSAQEDSTLELSTKVLEYGASGLPVLMRRSRVNSGAFGDNYPLFAQSTAEIVALLEDAFRNGSILREARERTQSVAVVHTFERVREDYVVPLLGLNDAARLE